MKRLNYVALPIILLGIWLLLNDTLSIGNIVLGSMFALMLNWLAFTVRPVRASAKHPLIALKLIWHVAVDITLSTIAVGRIVCQGKRSGFQPGFLRIPLTLTDPHGLAALACIVTYTPGTVWADYSETDNVLTLHVLDLQNEEQWLAVIQQRYQGPLIRIFE
ncbi:Na+/H+ antiporter subunit E [Alcaligenaceae bacterium]|nr:Na+/H+ antiporter subunit E [Alcaligenaceae bacterium]